MVRGTQDVPDKQDPGLGLLKGKKNQCNCPRLFKNKDDNVKDLKPKRGWH